MGAVEKKVYTVRAAEGSLMPRNGNPALVGGNGTSTLSGN